MSGKQVHPPPSGHAQQYGRFYPLEIVPEPGTGAGIRRVFPMRIRPRSVSCQVCALASKSIRPACLRCCMRRRMKSPSRPAVSPCLTRQCANSALEKPVSFSCHNADVIWLCDTVVPLILNAGNCHCVAPFLKSSPVGRNH